MSDPYRRGQYHREEIEAYTRKERLSTALYALGIILCVGLITAIMLRFL